jgi:hypothetical protein
MCTISLVLARALPVDDHDIIFGFSNLGSGCVILLRAWEEMKEDGCLDSARSMLALSAVDEGYLLAVCCGSVP